VVIPGTSATKGSVSFGGRIKAWSRRLKAYCNCGGGGDANSASC
jgi:hypothetical protein